MKFRVKVLQRHQHRSSNEKDDLIKESVVDVKEVVATMFKLLYGIGVEVQVEAIED